MPSCRDKGGKLPQFLLVAKGLVVRGGFVWGVGGYCGGHFLAVGPEDILSSGYSDRCPFPPYTSGDQTWATWGSQAVAPPPVWPHKGSWGSGDANYLFQNPYPQDLRTYLASGRGHDRTPFVPLLQETQEGGLLHVGTKPAP